MYKMLLSLILILRMFFSLSSAVLPNEVVSPDLGTGVRKTDYFPDYPHSDLDFADMSYVPVTVEDFTAGIDTVKALLESGASSTAVMESFHVVSDLFDTLSANMTIMNIRMYADVDDEAAEDLYTQALTIFLDVYDPFIYLIQELLKSDIRDVFITSERLTASDVTFYETYGGMSEGEKEISLRLTELRNDYADAANAGNLSKMTDSFMAVLRANKELMQYIEGYDNYIDYAYAEIYGRDYTVREAEAFFAAVKESVVPFVADYNDVRSLELEAAGDRGQLILKGDYTGADTLDAIRPYIGMMSGELLEAWDYMTDHNLYDITARKSKQSAGFTAQISGYNAPFFFNSPHGTINDFTTIIHEFGHYSSFYYHPDDWNDGFCSYDVAEVHSQGLELLFTQFYGELFGDYANIVENEVIRSILVNGLLNGARMAELELYAYTTPDVTPKMINDKFIELSKDYMLAANDYYWVRVHHLTDRPLYYISYATSAVGALSFWTEAQEQGFDKATDLYLKFVSLPYYAEFQEEFADILGINPMDPAYVAEIAETLHEKLSIDERLGRVPVFSHVSYTGLSVSPYYCLPTI